MNADREKRIATALTEGSTAGTLEALLREVEDSTYRTPGRREKRL